MAVSAYILIQTEVGKAAQVAQEVDGIDGVVSAEDVTGPYDVIARAEVPLIQKHYAQFGEHIPAELRAELDELEKRLAG
jgi:GTP-dependent phosphoenolpyruvate carboxykinase